MKPKLMKDLGHPVVAMLWACDSLKGLDNLFLQFDKNYTLENCKGSYGDCSRDDSSAFSVTTERMGPLGCGCKQQPKDNIHF
jgi:hypothetical protein